ncbi:MAG: LysR family transcriptional regulator [Roseateles depolymerans]|uniref:LysR family transcriptional regulator n=1 Tax=Roseateles depolymerans TaxID=76731 RepID=A0A2W5FMA0_9BURK|nr:MAG: LysR family transcriptional regulator [Roseateles depolymerans]
MNGPAWDDLRVFLSIARAGSLGGAGRQLGVSQPTMGRRLRVLEAAVGRSLFHRGPEGFALTEDGAQVLAHAERMEEEALAFERRLAGRSATLQGRLRVASSDWFGVHVLTPLCARFAQQHPQVQVELLTDARLFTLARREADLAFRIRPFDEPGVVQRRLKPLGYGLYARQDSPAAAPLPARGEGLAVITLDSGYRDFPDAQWLRTTLPEARVVFASNSRDAQARMCCEGLGAAVLPDLLAAAHPQLQRLQPPTEPPGREVWMGYHEDLRRTARLQALVQQVSGELGMRSDAAP